ncbi:AAA family ATPase [Jiella avicenniae]|uniref:AAA family ATPase n=1 Tax=Jiella avicenniae TaxID=2907202 RepID=A0A9X1P861_9HYPH|nr:AAA family ATPase [Jiella avicenniae]MCE7030951.1 AAA family ATPase [Jiella avicenniae]
MPVEDVEGADLQKQIGEQIDRRLKEMSPSVRLLFDRIRPVIPDHLANRLRAAKPALAVIHVASADWRQPAFEATMLALEDAVRTEAIVYAQSFHLPSGEVATRSWQRKKPRERSSQIMSTLSSGITIVALSTGEELDKAVAALADMTIDLTQLEEEDLRRTVEAAFPLEQISWPSGLSMPTVDPQWLDVAIGRSESGSDAVRLIMDAHARSGYDAGVPALDTLYGYGKAREWGLRLASALREYRAGTRSWRDVDAGALLVGPPGTGKTLYASALATSCHAAFIATSYSTWQGTGEGHLGDVTRAIRNSFAEAASQKPCILFIDEIDSLPARGTASRHDDWWRTIVNNLLECLDGTGRREGVIVIAACNDDRNLDPALVRSGRLDRRFYIGLPSEDDLTKIFAHHLPMVTEDEIQPAAVTLAGSASGADAARIARDVRHRARSEGREPTGADLLEIALPADDRPISLRRRIAVHEAGHAVAVLLQGRVPRSLSILSATGGAVIHDIPETEQLLEDLTAQLAIGLAGRAAEEVILGSVSAGAGGGDASDLWKATRLVAMIEGRYGLGTRLGVIETIDQASVERRLRIAYAEALMSAMRHRHAIDALAALALERGVLGRTALAEFWDIYGPASQSEDRGFASFRNAEVSDRWIGTP